MNNPVYCCILLVFFLHNLLYRLNDQVGSLNFTMLFTKNLLFEHKMVRLRNKQYFVEYKTEIMQRVLKMQ